MHGECEVCREFRPDTAPSGSRVRELVFGKRRVRLCSLHARLAEIVRVTTFEGLRKLFRENRGRRSFVPRRTVDSAPSSGERRRAGRRANDAPN